MLATLWMWQFSLPATHPVLTSDDLEFGIQHLCIITTTALSENNGYVSQRFDFVVILKHTIRLELEY